MKLFLADTIPSSLYLSSSLIQCRISMISYLITRF